MPPATTGLDGAGGHPQREIAAALQDCARAGLSVEQFPGGHIWGRVDCPTGARFLPVPLVSRRPGQQARRIRVFTAEHRGHRAGER